MSNSKKIPRKSSTKSTERFFSLVSKEFHARSEQILHYIKHKPTIGSLHEELLKEFLKNYLPTHISISSGFILYRDQRNRQISSQIDIIVYSNLYAPLYKVGELVVLPPEAVLCTIEVKTTINKSELIKSIDKNKNINTYNTKIKSFIFIYNKNISGKTVLQHLKNINFSNSMFQDLPELYALKSFIIYPDIASFSENNEVHKKPIYILFDNIENLELEIFYGRIYTHIEEAINSEIKTGIKLSREIFNIDENGGFVLYHNGRKAYVLSTGTISHNSFDIICKNSNVIRYSALK